MRIFLTALLLAAAMPVWPATNAYAQATCRQKCMDDEKACLARTNNKGQCGDRAKSCADKCK